MDKSTETDDIFIAQEFYGTIRRMPRYNTTDTKNVDTNELDPCLAAKIRLAGNGKCRSSTTWVLITSLILLLTSIFILLFVLVTWFPKEYPRLSLPEPTRVQHDRILTPMKIHRDPDEVFGRVIPTEPDKLLEAYNGKIYWNQYPETRRSPIQGEVELKRAQGNQRINSVADGDAVSSHGVADSKNNLFGNTTEMTVVGKTMSSTIINKVTSTKPPAIEVTENSFTTSAASPVVYKSSVLDNMPDSEISTVFRLDPYPKQQLNLAKSTMSPPLEVKQISESSDSEDMLEPFVNTNLYGPYQFIKTDYVGETCSDYLEAGNTESGVYKLKLNGVGEFYALCIMENNEAWMVLQQRQDGQEVFYNKTFEDYSLGFGDQASDHWLGLEKVRALLNNYKVEMRMEARGDRCDRKKGSLYLVGRYNFSISTRKEGYRLGIYRILSGNFTDPYSDISNSNGAEFATIDKNPNSMNCAELRKLGAWWHPPSCSFITLNGAYNVNKCHSWSGMQIYARERSRQGSHYKQSHHRPRFTRLALKVTGKV
ncbi:unnamed protein product [Bursaphelenchus xylophilus]|uniref:(pine wood nematode) hypothetical protein n=1 Tax=Bursaphelenchus xylophilus TaxID=6326 RepID=A0A1I7RR40_BURXY|nr:unnamed protein product [Bursaphelenchus xylophilus]CAG9130831.1 unnamed protein product [Bursaphelenchus xylophilus]